MSDMTLKARLFGDDVSMSKTFHGAGRASDTLGTKLGHLGKVGLVGAVSGGALLAAGGVAALGVAMVHGVQDAASYQTLAQKTAAVLKSTGNVAHQSVKGIQARAAALESLSGVDEELIISGQNVLATFTKVRDGVGKGNDIFNQATTAALNMSTALGTDMQSSVIQLGKALNDPIKGVTALQRVGVSFTAEQKKQIRTLVESGKTMEAQKLILRELKTEFGGAAQAAGQGFNGAMARAKDSISDAFRAIGMKLLPTLTKFANYVATNAGPFIDRLSAAFGRAWGWVSGKLWPALQQGYQTILPGVKQALAIVTGGVDGGSVSWKKIGDIITTKVIPVLAAAIRVWLPLIATNIRVVVEDIKAWWRVVSTLISVFKPAFSIIIGLTVSLMRVWAAMLRALGNVPGFEWAKRAADKMQNAADKAAAIKSAIDRIPSEKNVTVNVGARVMTGRIKVGNEHVNVGMRAKGGPVRRGMPYIVGENEPELFVPGANGRVFNSSQVGGGGGVVINVNGATIGTPDGIAREIETALSALRRKQGGRLAFT